ncbi:MAG: hypothetical protein BMS9Abin31_0878 [Gammaproteobacteria bacterium]|nr:MAG: hypothetical protein BMS9Abin31_0878 [Gammaproteobacteria bacterium]
MVNYRRSEVKGGTYFFTVNLQDRKEDYLTLYIGQLRESFRIVKHQYPFEIIASVILPDHLHIIWKLPKDDANYSARWKAIKSKFTRLVIKEGVLLKKNKRSYLLAFYFSSDHEYTQCLMIHKTMHLYMQHNNNIVFYYSH